MQVLWSRAVQARSSCRCNSCIHATTTLARRTTTAASKRRLRVSDVFTACYSSILATAVFVDAGVKEDRRKQWDKLIEEVRKPSKPKDVQPGLETEHWQVQKPKLYEAETTAVPYSIYAPPEEHTSPLPQKSRQPAIGARLSHLDWVLRNTTAERIALRDVDTLHEPGMNEAGQWIDELPDPDLENREPKTPLQLLCYEEMVRDLVNSILHQSRVFSKEPQSGHSSLNTQQELSKMARRFVALGAEESPVPSYQYDNLEVVDEERKKLHQSLWTLCYAVSRGQTDVNVAITKICYNMLVSTVPPSIITYNLLLNEFMKLGRSDLAQIVVDSFLYESRFRPNKKTIRLLLDHYRAKSDFLGFRDIVQRMRGCSEDMLIRRRHISELSDGGVEFWAYNNKTIHRGGFIRQKAPRSRPIFNSLILGYLEFHHVRAAVRHTRSGLREGYEISADTLCAVIKRIVDKLDSYAGASLLKALASQWETGSIVSITVYTKELRYRINQLLHLCGIDPESGPTWYSLRSGISPTGLSHVLRRMKLDTLADATERSAAFILQLDAALGLSGLDFKYAKLTSKVGSRASTSQRLHWALQITRKQSEAEEIRRANKLRLIYDGRQLRLRVLENMVASGAELILTRLSKVLEIQVAVRKRELESLICRTVPVDQETAAIYVQALTSDAARPPLFDGYPMFQQKKSMSNCFDPLSYLEKNLFDVDSKQFAWHRKRLAMIREADDFAKRRGHTLKRVSNLKNLLVRYMQHVNGHQTRQVTQENAMPKRENIRIHVDSEISKTLERYIRKTYNTTTLHPVQVDDSVELVQSPNVPATAVEKRDAPINIHESEHSSARHEDESRLPKLLPPSPTLPLQPYPLASGRNRHSPAPKHEMSEGIPRLPPVPLGYPPLERLPTFAAVG